MSAGAWVSVVKSRLVEWAALRRGGFDSLIVVIGVIATGLAGLVLEDLLPAEGSPEVLPWRAVWALILVGVLVWLLAVRRTLRRHFGTLYYLFGLPARMTDRHAERLREESCRYQTYRIVRMQPGPGWDEAAHSVALADRMNDAMNQDDVATGFHLAPNLLWDLAMGVGGQLAGRSGLGLVELDRALVRWSPSPPSGIRAFAALERRRIPAGEPSSGVPTIIVNLTEAAPSWPTNWHVGEAVSVGVFAGAGHEASPVRVAPTATGAGLIVHPWHAVEQVVAAVCDMVHSHPDRPVLMFARMPKSVALAIGMQLGAKARPLCGRAGCDQEACQDPWMTLTPLRLIQDGPSNAGTRYEFVRVHPSQPPLERLVERIARLSAGGPGAEGQTTVVNLTAHDLVLYQEGRPSATIRKQGEMARPEEELRDRPAIQTVLGTPPVKALHYTGTVAGLPEPVPGTVFVVSRLTAQALSRSDLLFPGGEVRDEDNRIVGCEFLAAVTPRHTRADLVPSRWTVPLPESTLPASDWSTCTRPSPVGSTGRRSSMRRRTSRTGSRH